MKKTTLPSFTKSILLTLLVVLIYLTNSVVNRKNLEMRLNHNMQNPIISAINLIQKSQGILKDKLVSSKSAAMHVCFDGVTAKQFNLSKLCLETFRDRRRHISFGGHVRIA